MLLFPLVPTGPVMSALGVAAFVVPAFVVPGADFPAWAPLAAGAVGLVTLAVVVYQTVRYFRNHRDD